MSDRQPFLRRGDMIISPDDQLQGYEMLVDAYPGDIVMANQFRPFGGAPVPEPNQPMPGWLSRHINPIKE